MRRLFLFYASEYELENNKNKYLFCDLKNSLIKYDESSNKFLFYSKYKDEPEEILIQHLCLVYDEKLIIMLKQFLKISFEYSKKISKEGTVEKFNEPEIYSEIENYILKCSYPGNEPKSIFHLVAEFFYKYAAGHKLANGNKRLTFMFMINILRYFGYHFYWTKGKKTNYKIHEKDITNWVTKSHSLHGEEKEKYIDELADWIKSNCTIALEWR